MPPPTPELGSTPYITPTPTFEEQFRRPTAEEPIPEWAHQHLPALTEYLLEQPWVTDTLTAFELHTVELLLRDGVSQANAIELAIEEGLLSGPDPFAMDIIQSIHGFGSAPEVTDPKQIQVEHRTINLPLRGQTNLLILRAQPGSKVSMDLLENAVKEAERFMDVPFPTDQVTLEFTKGKDSGHEFRDGQFKGDDWSGKVQVNPMHDQHALVTTNYSPGNEKRLAEVIAHEVAHYYWNHHITWIDEGMAETLMSYIENDRVGGPIALSSPECRWYPGLFFLENDSTLRREYDKFQCNYTLGQSLFLAIEASIGKEEFLRGARRLYHTRFTPSIESVRAAFPNSGGTPEIINYHYYGDPDSYDVDNPPQPMQLPTAQLTSVRLRLERMQTFPPWDFTPISSFSASKYHGPIILVVGTQDYGQGGKPYLALTIKHLN